MNIKDNKKYLNEQIITYIGNKRKLLNEIEHEIVKIKKHLKKDKLDMADIFSGSGIVARMMKKHANLIIANDLEQYSRIINECYLSNKSEFNDNIYNYYYEVINDRVKNKKIRGIVSENYAPYSDEDIKHGERVFFTRYNAEIIDTIRNEINEIPEELQKFFLAPLIYSASVNNNTGGIFKGFYKDSKTGIGKFGGNGSHALKRIKGKIELLKPVLSNHECEYRVYQSDSNDLVKELEPLDVIYIDPPYNQHPYGSNYFMLNLIVDNCLDSEVSKVSGIPKNWNRSQYNKKQFALKSFEDLVSNAKAKYLIVSYNSEGFITFDEISSVLKKHGDLKAREIKYNTYRASRNLKNRNLYVHEYIFVLKKWEEKNGKTI